MNCEEFEKIGLDMGRDQSLGVAERAAALKHAAVCAQCSALQRSWIAASEDLRLYAAAIRAAEAPARVEMRLRLAFRTAHHAVKTRRLAWWTTAALSTAAAAIAFVAARDWQPANQTGNSANAKSVPVHAGELSPKATGANAPEEATDEALGATATEESEFVPLPGTLAADSAAASVVRVRMPRVALAAWGLPVNEEGADEWIQVDLLIADDGQPQAVRLSR